MQSAQSINATAPITQAAFAKLVKVSKQMVGKGIRAGRLPPEFLVRDDSGRVAGIAEPELAARAWKASADHSKAPGYVKERADARAHGGVTAAAAARVPPAQPSEPDDDQREPVPIRDDMSLTEATAIEKVWRARLAELKYKQDSGELVPARDVEAHMANVFSSCKTKLLGVPSRVRQQDPGLTTAQLALIDSVIREALEGLAAEGGGLDLAAEGGAA